MATDFETIKDIVQKSEQMFNVSDDNSEITLIGSEISFTFNKDGSIDHISNQRFIDYNE